MLSAIWNDDKLMSILAGLISALSVFLLVYAVFQWLVQRPEFELRQVELAGELERTNLIGFEANVLPNIRGSFFSINLEQVRQLVEKQAWVRKASVQRTWPNGLKIQIQEHTPLAYWGDTRLINTYGEVFTANLDEVGEGRLPATLDGPAGSELLVAKRYVEVISQLDRLGMQPEKVLLSDRYGWTIHTDTGLHIELGREQENLSIQKKMERLITVYPTIKTEVMAAIERIDLRYPRGVAVKGQRLATAVPAGAGSARLN